MRTFDHFVIRDLRAGRIALGPKESAELGEALVHADQMAVKDHQRIASLEAEVGRLELNLNSSVRSHGMLVAAVTNCCTVPKINEIMRAKLEMTTSNGEGEK